MTVFIQYGWEMISQCTCGGRLQKNYRNNLLPTYELKVYPKENKWVVFKSNRSIITGTEQELEKQLEELAVLANKTSAIEDV